MTAFLPSRSQQAPVGRDVPAVLQRSGSVQLGRRDGQTVGPEDRRLAARRGGAAEPRIRSGPGTYPHTRLRRGAESQPMTRLVSPQVASCGESERPTLGWCVPPAAGTGRRKPNCWCWTLTWTTGRERRTEVDRVMSSDRDGNDDKKEDLGGFFCFVFDRKISTC